jgi:predicted RNase H-related nuclease YkuK (DUF458 family)
MFYQFIQSYVVLQSMTRGNRNVVTESYTTSVKVLPIINVVGHPCTMTLNKSVVDSIKYLYQKITFCHNISVSSCHTLQYHITLYKLVEHVSLRGNDEFSYCNTLDHNTSLLCFLEKALFTRLLLLES